MVMVGRSSDAALFEGYSRGSPKKYLKNPKITEFEQRYRSGTAPGACRSGPGGAVACQNFLHMTGRRSQLEEGTTFAVLSIRRSNPDMTLREIPERLGISASGLDHCLKAMIHKGWVEVQNFGQSRNKFGYIAVPTPQSRVEKALLTRRFLRRKMSEFEAPKVEIDVLQAEAGTTSTLGEGLQANLAL